MAVNRKDECRGNRRIDQSEKILFALFRVLAGSNN